VEAKREGVERKKIKKGAIIRKESKIERKVIKVGTHTQVP
jgi:hypothetical protein